MRKFCLVLIVVVFSFGLLQDITHAAGINKIQPPVAHKISKQKPLPDLVIAAIIKPQPASAVIDGPLCFGVRVKNLGPCSVQGTKTAIRFGGESSPVLVDTPPLKIGEQQPTVRCLSVKKPGKYLVHFQLDAQNAIKEANEQNNKKTLSITIGVPKAEIANFSFGTIGYQGWECKVRNGGNNFDLTVEVNVSPVNPSVGDFGKTATLILGSGAGTKSLGRSNINIPSGTQMRVVVRTLPSRHKIIEKTFTKN